MDVEEEALEEELVDKPGTTIGTKFSVLHCIRIPFLMRCGFLQLIFPAIFDENWFFTTGPTVIIPVIFAEFSE